MFDAANRLTTAAPVSGTGTETYVYDGHGRRVSVLRTGQNKRYAAYTTDGKLRYEIGADTTATKYIYLGNSLLARNGDAPAQTMPPAVPAPLTSNEPDPSTDGIYTLNWSTVLNVDRYELEETLQGASPTVSNLLLATSWTTSSARPEGYHAYRARACNAAGCSAWTGSYTIHVQFGTPPDAPNPLTASPNPTTTGLFTVSWANVGSGITYKLIETTGGGWVTLVNDACTTTCTTSWAPGTARPIGSYTFLAQTCNATGCSNSYPLTVAVQEDATFPPPTGSIWASPNPSTDGNYTVQWTAVSGATYYKLYEKDNGVEQGVIQNGASLSWSPSSPRITGDYEYWVKACKILVNGTHVCSEDSSVYTERVRLPGVPTTPEWIGFSPTNNGNNAVICNNVNPRTFTVYWGASSGSVDHYEILESNHVNSNEVTETSAGSTANLPLTRWKIPGDTYTAYFYQVRACNASGGCSAYRGIAEMCVGTSSIFGPNRVVSTTYYHTDALGSPVAETNAAGTVTQRSRYEPYGLPANTPFPDAPGYTGHVADSFTQLSYMQQRYYDPLIGRFLSVDPAVNSANGGSFNRYWYANNSPYKFTDPDGRESREFNWENRQLGITPPPRSPDDYLGPAIGAALGVVSAPAMVYGAVELGVAALTNPATTATIINTVAEVAAGDALGGTSLVVGTSTLAHAADAALDAGKTYGPYHRLGDAAENIQSIRASGELYGNPPKNTFQTDFAKVKAYDGPLPPGAKGF